MTKKPLPHSGQHAPRAFLVCFLSQKADQKGHQTDGLMPFSLFSQKPLFLKLLDKCVNIFFGKCRVNIVFGKQFID